jgi:hypothetical protein
MKYRTVLVVLAIALCATFALGTTLGTIGGLRTGPLSTLDIAVEIVRPETAEVPGLMPLTVRLTNMGDTSGLVDSLQVTISDGYYSLATGIPKRPGESKLEYMPDPWVYGGGTETCTAWITCPADSNHSNDTDVVIVRTPSALDVAADIVRPDTYEVPGLIPIAVRLTNMGDTFALVDSVHVKMSDGYNSFTTGVPLNPSESTLAYMPILWVCPVGCYETCTAWITCPADTNHSNDTDVMFVRTASAMDVVTEIVSPADSEDPGLVPVQIRLTNMFIVPALVPRLDVKVPGGYADSMLNIAVAPGVDTVVTLNPWIYGGGTETCMAYITYPADSNHWNDTCIVVVSGGGIAGRDPMEPHAGLSLTLTPSPLADGVLQVEYSLNKSGPASVTVFDVLGRPVARRDFTGADAGEFPLNLRSLSAGVYLVRLEDGRRSVVQKLVVQR